MFLFLTRDNERAPLHTLMKLDDAGYIPVSYKVDTDKATYMPYR